MVARRFVFALLAVLIAGVASAADPAGKPGPTADLGYDGSGRLVEQPRLKLNMFALSNSVAEVDKADLRAFGQWVADALQMFADISASGEDAVVTASAANAKAGTKSRAMVDPKALIEKSLTERQAKTDSMIGQLKQLRPPKLRNPDIARALAFAVRDFSEAGVKLGATARAQGLMIKAAISRDLPGSRENLIDWLQGVVSLMDWTDRSTSRQIEAGVGGTPDLWLWRAEIEEAQVFATVFRDLLFLVEQRRLPAAVGRQNIQENLTAMAEWLKRADIQVRQEMSRARTSPEASLTRGRWLEAVYTNYQQELSVQRALHSWMAINVPRIYEEMRPTPPESRERVRLVNWAAYEKLESASLVLDIERYRLLAAMP